MDVEFGTLEGNPDTEEDVWWIGEETRAIQLAVGTTTISVTVTAEDGTSSQAYEVVANRGSPAADADVTVDSGSFSLSWPGTVAEGTTLVCTLTNTSSTEQDWPVVAFLHSSADASRALIAEDPIIPASSPDYRADVQLATAQTPALENYNLGCGELFSGGSRTVYAIYGYEKSDWNGQAAAAASRSIVVDVFSDDASEGDEHWQTRSSIWITGAGDLSYTLTGLTNEVSYDIQFRAVVGTTAGDWSETHTVTPVPANRNPAFGHGETGLRSVVEGTAANGNVGPPVAATDPDDDALTYSLQSGADVFDLDSATGQLSTKAALDHETASSHSVTVAVSDAKDTDGEADTAVDATIDVEVSVIPPPLTASFQIGPASHSTDVPNPESPAGQLTFTMRFSAPLSDDIDGASLRDHAFQVTNTHVISVEPINGRRDCWKVTIWAPNANITVTLLGHEDCAAEHAICSYQGQPLSNSPTGRIRHSGPPMKARFTTVPTTHDSTEAITVTVHFTYGVRLEPATMRDHIFEVTGGTITSAVRDPENSQFWTLTVDPERTEDIVVTVPATTDCTVEHALCSGLLPFSISPTVTIPHDGTADAQALPLFTAAFENVPASFSGTSPLTLRLRYSEPLRRGFSHSFLRDEALQVSEFARLTILLSAWLVALLLRQRM